MPVIIKRFGGILAIIAVIWAIILLYPHLLFTVSEWQKQFNLVLSASLRSLKQHSYQAGWSLIAVSFFYGIFHAVGPGHGKFILTSYLSLEKTKLPKAMKITLLSALVQGLVAIILVTVIVVLFTLSRSYFNLTLKWVERGSFLLMALFGIYFCYQGLKSLCYKQKAKKTFHIRKIHSYQPLNPTLVVQQNSHTMGCECGHKHLPSATEMAQAKNWQSTIMLIFSIGLRPCSGAILVLFLAYTLDLYLWGVLSALAMALGTGITLTLFAWFVLFARQKAIQVGHWYVSLNTSRHLQQWLKLVIGSALIIMGIVLLHSSLLDASTNLLFKK